MINCWGSRLKTDKWRCKSRTKCPFHRTSVCGDETEGSLICSYPRSLGGTNECYIRHVVLCWEEWEKLKHRYSPSIQRVLETAGNIPLKQRQVERICGLPILHHDIGKLSEEYQKETFYRHEMLSAYFVYRYGMTSCREMGLSDYECEFLASMSAAAIYLHHEALQVSHRHFEMRAPTYSYLLSLLSDKKFSMLAGWNNITSKLENQALGTRYSYSAFKEQIGGSDVARTLGTVITYIDGSPKALAIRIAVASVLQPLTICDNIAATARGGEPSRLSKFLGAGEI